MKNLQRGFVIPLVIAIVALIAIGGGYIIVRNKIKTNTEPFRNALNVTSDVMTGTGSTTPQDPATCDSMPVGQDKDDCYYAYAQSKLSVEFCTKIESTINKNGCIGLIAQKTSNASVCENIQPANVSKAETRSTCYDTVAIKTKNIALCEKITDVSLKKGCIETISPQSVVKPIEITSPTSGKIFKIGGTMTISWKGGTKSIHVGVAPTFGANKGIIYWISNNSQPNSSFVWNIKSGCKLYPDMSKCSDIEAGTYNVYIEDIESPTSYSSVMVNNKEVADSVKGIIIQ